jgi:hypothetical protein
MRKRWPLFLILSVLLVPSVAAAQDGGGTGLVMSYPAAIGVVWDVSPHVALRPSASFSAGWSDQTALAGGSGSASGSNRGFAVGIAVLFYVAQRESLSLYVTPQFSYGRSRSTSSSSQAGAGAQHGSSAAYGFSGSFGAEHPISKRFGVFGEVGFTYSDQRSNTSASQFASSTTLRSLGTRGSVGTILHF